MDSFSLFSIPELIMKYQSYTSPCEESKDLLLYLWNYHVPFITSQCKIFFSSSNFVDYQDVLQTCFFTFCETLNNYDSKRGKLTTALVNPLRHTFTEYISYSNGFTLHENLMSLHFKTIIEENNLTGNEDIQFLTELYNQKYVTHPITAKSLLKYRSYYLMQEKIYLDQYPAEFLSAALDTSFTDSVAYTVETHEAYRLILDYITKKAEGNDRCLLLYLFGFISSIEIDGFHYSIGQKPHPVDPLRKAYAKILPSLAQYLYNNNYITTNNLSDLKNFLYNTIIQSRDFFSK